MMKKNKKMLNIGLVEFFGVTIFLAVISVAINKSNFLSAQLLSGTNCTNTEECALGLVCSTEFGECNTSDTCKPGEPCIAVCAGTCIAQNEQEEENIPALRPTVEVQQSYVAKKRCTDTINTECGHLLWFSLAEVDGSLIHRDQNPLITLHAWSFEEEKYLETGTLPTFIHNPAGEITALSIDITSLENATYPYCTFHLLRFSQGNEEIAWSTKLIFENEDRLPTVRVSPPNIIGVPTLEDQPIALRSSSASSLDLSSQATSSQISTPNSGSLVSSSSSKSVSQSTFSDIEDGTLLAEAARSLSEQNVIKGYPDGRFKSKRHVIRAEAAKMLLEARYGKNIPELQFTGQFSDVSRNEWYTKYVLYAAELGIINGYPNGLFKPAETVNTAEFLKMISLTFAVEKNYPYSYIDVDESDWFDAFAGAATFFELLPLRPYYVLWPNMHMTREEVVIAIYNLQNRIGKLSK